MRRFLIVSLVFVVLAIIAGACRLTTEDETANATPIAAIVKRLGGPEADGETRLAFDKWGDIYIVGCFSGAVADLDGNGMYETLGVGKCDAYVSKFDINGNFIWSKRFGGAEDDGKEWTIAVATDMGGNVYIAGSVNSTADLNGDNDTDDPGELSSGTGNDIFVTCFDKTGAFQWAKRIGGSGDEIGYSIAIGNGNLIYVVGASDNDVDINGDGDTLDGGESKSGYGSHDVIVLALTSSGEYVWSRRLGGTGTDFATSVAVSKDNHVYVTGCIMGDVDLNGDGSLSIFYPEKASQVNGPFDIFVSKFTAAGEFILAKRFGGLYADWPMYIMTDYDGNVYLTGYITHNADLDGNGAIGTEYPEYWAEPYGDRDTLLLKLSADLTYTWAKRLGGPDPEGGCSICCDIFGNVYLVAAIRRVCDLNGDGIIGNANGELTSDAKYDIGVVKFNTNGIFQGSLRLGGSESDFGYSILYGAGPALYLSGLVGGTADLDGDGNISQTAETTVYGSEDAVLIKLDPSLLVP